MMHAVKNVANERPMVLAENLRKIYSRGSERITVLDGIHLSVSEGDYVALMGPSGSGKTTLMNLIGGLDKETSGRVVVDGVALGELSEAGRAKWRSHSVGFIFQFYHLIPVLSAVRNVEVPLLLTDLGRRERRERALRALDAVGLSERANHHPHQLSGGQLQRVAIARAIVSDPKLLVADEPTGDLDATSANEILNMLDVLNKDFGKTIIMVTHDPKAASRATTRMHLEKGILSEGMR